MIRMNEPNFTFEQTIHECRLGITGNDAFLTKITSLTQNLINEGRAYIDAAALGELYKLKALNSLAEKDPAVIGTLRKSELINFYDYYMLEEKKSARKIYDELLNSAKEKCPFCGGIGTPRNLDHYLPKAHFPQFSILPKNLVPACRDCNMDGKSQRFATNAEDQILQPYTDHDKFFLQQWIIARYIPGQASKPGIFEYSVKVPVTWTETERKRVEKHFHDFSLAKRYATKAAEGLGLTLSQADNLSKHGLTSESICSILLQPGVKNAPFENHWQKGMFQALINYFLNR